MTNSPNTINRRVLLIAYHYPPVKVSSGIQRTLKFSAYLRENGWEPMVLTISPRAYEQVSDEQMAEIPTEMVVARAFGLDTARHLSIGDRYPGWLAQPDRWVSWLPAAVWRGMAMIRRYRPAIIMSTYPIATAHLIGLSLKRLSGLPWIADFRDSMTEPGYPRDPATWRIHRRLEQAIIRRCDRAVFTTEGTLQMYAERYPDKPASNWSVIENGFDEENFRDAEAGFKSSPLGQSGQITLIHSGVLYPQERDPKPFFAALRTLKESGEISAGQLQVVLRATGSDDLYRPLLNDLGLTDMVKLAPTVSYRDALQEMLQADGLLLFQAGMCNHQIPAKLYEYLRAGRPIFALTDPIGNTASSLRAANALDIVDITDTDDIAAGLQRFIERIKADVCQGVPREIANLHSRRSRTRELALLMDQVVEGNPVSNGGPKVI
jgi:glycosyltransferase involved in cell wall biosynthesis